MSHEKGVWSHLDSSENHTLEKNMDQKPWDGDKMIEKDNKYRWCWKRSPLLIVMWSPARVDGEHWEMHYPAQQENIMPPFFGFRPFYGKRALKLAKVTRDFCVLPLLRTTFRYPEGRTAWPLGCQISLSFSLIATQILNPPNFPISETAVSMVEPLPGSSYRAWSFPRFACCVSSGDFGRFWEPYRKWARINSLVSKVKAGEKSKECLRISQKSLQR